MLSERRRLLAFGEDPIDDEVDAFLSSRAHDAQVQLSSRTASDAGPWCSLTAIYFLVMIVNGGLIGALGPSLEPIGRAVGLKDAALARLLLQNRLCKFAGNLIWCGFARRLQRPHGIGRPHALFGGLMLLTASSAIMIGHATEPASLQVALLSWGVAYGISDAGVTTLTVWRWANDNRRRRIDVSVLNAGFTVGALLAPTLVVASLRYGVGRWAFYAIAGLSVFTATLLGMQPAMALPLSSKDSADEAPPSSQKENGGGDRLLLPRGRDDEWHTLWEEVRQQKYERRFIWMTAVALCCVTGCEHGMATWLSAFGVESGGLGEQRMGVITSVYWGVMCFGRLLWAGISGCVTSSWPMLFFDLITCLLSALLLLCARAFRFAFEPLLWLSAMGMGLGVSSALPCVYSLVPEAHVKMTPWAITLLNAASTVGETASPYLIGLAFGAKQYWMLAASMSALMAVAVAVATLAWRAAERQKWVPRRDGAYGGGL